MCGGVFIMNPVLFDCGTRLGGTNGRHNRLGVHYESPENNPVENVHSIQTDSRTSIAIFC